MKTSQLSFYYIGVYQCKRKVPVLSFSPSYSLRTFTLNTVFRNGSVTNGSILGLYSEKTCPFVHPFLSLIRSSFRVSMKSMLGYKLLWIEVTLGIKGKISDIIVTKTKAGVAQWTILSKIKTIVVLFYKIWSSKKNQTFFQIWSCWVSNERPRFVLCDLDLLSKFRQQLEREEQREWKASNYFKNALPEVDQPENLKRNHGGSCIRYLDVKIHIFQVDSILWVLWKSWNGMKRY